MAVESRPRSVNLGFACAVGTLLVAGLLFRLAVANDLGSLAIQHLPVLDERVHDQLAQEILSSGWRPQRPFFKAPLYPYFLAASYAAFGHSFPAVRVVQAVIGALTVLVIASIGHRVGGRPGALVSGAIAALYVQTTLYAALLMKATLVLLFMSLFVLCGVWERGERRRRALPFLSGVFLGLACLLRGNLLVLLPIVVVWRLLEGAAASPARRLHERLWSAAMPAAGLLLVVMPFATLNYLASGEVILTESTGGITFYLGNRQGASGFYEALYPGRQGPNFEEIDGRRKAAEILSTRSGAPVAESSLSSAAASRVLGRETWRQIAERPGQWSRLMARKLVLFWNAYEAPTGNSIYVYELASRWLRLDPLTFGLVAPLGLFGLLVLVWQRRCVFLPVVAFGRLRLGGGLLRHGAVQVPDPSGADTRGLPGSRGAGQSSEGSRASPSGGSGRPTSRLLPAGASAPGPGAAASGRPGHRPLSFRSSRERAESVGARLWPESRGRAEEHRRGAPSGTRDRARRSDPAGARRACGGSASSRHGVVRRRTTGGGEGQLPSVARRARHRLRASERGGLHGDPRPGRSRADAAPRAQRQSRRGRDRIGTAPAGSGAPMKRSLSPARRNRAGVG